MTQTATVSVVLPTFNSAEYLTQAVGSVIAQSFRCWELIIVDDGSTDETPLVADKLLSQSHQIRFLRTPQNSGRPAIPRNIGISEARGEYVAFLDSDDYWLPSKLERQVRVLQNHPEVELVHSYLWSFRKFNYLPGLLHLSNPLRRRGSLSHVLRNNPVATSSVMVRRCTLEDLSGFSTTPELCVIEDYELWLRVAARAPLRYLSEIHGFYRLRDGSLSSKADFSSLHAYLDTHFGSRASTPAPRSWRLARKLLGYPLALFFHLVDAPVRNLTGREPRFF